MYAYAGSNPISFSDPFGLAAQDIIVTGEQSRAIVNYLMARSETFRLAYEKIGADHSITLTINDLVGSDAQAFPSQFVGSACGNICAIYFSAVDLNQGNMDLPGDSKYVFTAASVMAHEFGHAAGHFSKTTGIDPSCGADPAPGGTGCIIDFENKVRAELPKGEGGGAREKY